MLLVGRTPLANGDHHSLTAKRLIDPATITTIVARGSPPTAAGGLGDDRARR